MLRKVIAVTVGFIVAWVAMTTMLTQLDFKGVWWHLLGFGEPVLPMYYLPALLGGIIGGYLARQRGWLCGLIVGVLLMTVGFMAMSFYFWTLYHTPNIADMTISGIYYLWTNTWWYVLAATISGMAGGLLGQFLAHKWHSRSEKRANASSSKD
jgi:hypothetical protein